MIPDQQDSSPFNVPSPERQAVDTIRGYEYQIWQSVWAWITLRHNESLFLEKAEDFEVVSDNKLRSTQVKNTSSTTSVTLNSPSVIEAIVNFWKLQQANPEYTVRFNLLTTSPRGHEASNPFDGVKGLDYWDRCRSDETDVAPLRNELIGQTRLPDDLKEFLRVAVASEVRDKLVKRIDWVTSQQDHEAIKASIKTWIVGYGVDTYSLQPSDSAKFLPTLYDYVQTTIRKDVDRRLDLADFAKLFEDFATHTYTPAQIQSIRTLARVAVSPALTSASIAIDSESFYESTWIERLIRRSDLAIDLENRLKRNGFVLLKGSTGMGKSTLAALFAHRSQTEWRRLDFRDKKAAEIREYFLRLILREGEERPAFDYVIDDLNFDDHVSTYDKQLVEFVHSVFSRGGHIILTSQGHLSSRARLALDLPESVFFDIPQLSTAEVAELCLLNGCPRGPLLTAWSNIILATTSGHPLLAHARIKKLASENWPRPVFESITDESGAEDVRSEIRRSFRDYVPNEDSRTLAYRLSIFSGPFRRTQALHLAGHPPANSNPGEAFDYLVGPWVERFSTHDFKLSPLLKGSASENFDSQMVLNLHRSAAYAYFVDGTLTQTDVSGILLQGILGKIPPPLEKIAIELEKVPATDWGLIADAIDWFSYLAIGDNQILFDTHPETSLHLRRLQFRVAIQTNPERAAPVVAGWHAELNQYEAVGGESGQLIRRFLFFQLFEGSVWPRVEVPVPLRLLIDSIVTTISIARALESAANHDREAKNFLEQVRVQIGLAQANHDFYVAEELEPDPNALVDITGWVFFISLRCKSLADVVEFFDALAENSSPAVDELWNYVGSNEFSAIRLINIAWLSEQKRDYPNWPLVVASLEKIKELATSKNARTVIAAVFRTEAIISEEYVKGDAIQIIEEGFSRLGERHSFLLDYLAKIHMRHGRPAEALRCWREIPPESEAQVTSWRIFTHHEAIFCAGEIADWTSAIQYAEAGEQAARRLAHMGQVVAVGYLAEKALALWSSGEFSSSLTAFGEVVQKLGSLSDPMTDRLSLRLHVNLLMTMRWLNGERVEVTKPALGMFSSFIDPEVDPKYFVPRSSFENMIGLMLEHLELKLAVSLLDFSNLIAKFSQFVERMTKILAEKDGNAEPIPYDQRLTYSLFFAILVSWAVKYPDRELPFHVWQSELDSNGLLTSELIEYLDFLRAATAADAVGRMALLRGPRSQHQMLALCLFLSAFDPLKPTDLLVVDARIVADDEMFRLWRGETEELVEKLVARGWKDIVETQRFALSSPMSTVPRLEAAIADLLTRGTQKTARILLAAEAAAGVPLRSDFRTTLVKMAIVDE